MTVEEYQELLALLEELAQEQLVNRKTSENFADDPKYDKSFRDSQLEWAKKYGIMHSRIERAIRNIKGTHVIMHLE